MFDPFILMPHRIRAVGWIYGNNVIPRFITFSLMQIPVLPESSELHEAENWMEIRLPFNTELLSERHLLLSDCKGLASDGAGTLHYKIVMLSTVEA